MTSEEALSQHGGVVIDIWTLRREGDWIVIPTNVGWKRNGWNVMGRGLAAQASDRYPELAFSYGIACRDWHQKWPLVPIPTMTIFDPTRLVLVPTKPLNPAAPHLSWQGPATLECVRRGIDDLSDMIAGRCTQPSATTDQIEQYKTGRFLVPALGCGNGGLSIAQVRPLLEKLRDQFPDQVVLVLP